MRRNRHFLELIIIVAVVAVAVAVYRNSQPPPSDELPELGEGLRLYRARQYSQAIPYFSEVLRRQPQVLKARLYRGLCYVGLDKKGEARADFETAKQSEPILLQYMYPKLSLVLYRESARLYLAEGEYDLALADAEKAIGRSEIKQVHAGGWPFDRDWAESYGLRGLAYAGLKRYQEASSDLYMASFVGDDKTQKLAHRHIAAVELLRYNNPETAQSDYEQSQGAEDDGCFLCLQLRPWEGTDKRLRPPAALEVR